MFKNNKINNDASNQSEDAVVGFLKEFNIPITEEHHFFATYTSHPLSRSDFGLLLQRFTGPMKGDIYGDGDEDWLDTALKPSIDQEQLRIGIDMLIKYGFTIPLNMDCYNALIISETCNLELIEMLKKCDECPLKDDVKASLASILCTTKKKHYPLYHFGLTELLASQGDKPLPYQGNSTSIIKEMMNKYQLMKTNELKSTIHTIQMDDAYRQDLIKLINDYRFDGNTCANLISILKTLSAHGTDFDKHFSLILRISHNYSYLPKQESVIKSLCGMGLNPNTHYEIFDQFINKDAAESLINFIPLLAQCELKPSEDQTLFIKCIDAIDTLTALFSQFLTLNLNKAVLRYLLEQIANNSSNPYRSPIILFKLYKTLAFFKDPSSITITTFEVIVKAIAESERAHTEGPLNKSEATRSLEALLQKIANSRFEDIDITFDASHGYLLTFKDEPTIALNELLRLANFDHISLSFSEINSLGNIIATFDQDFITNTANYHEHHILRDIPKPAQRAIAYYTTHHYKNINRLFRGLPLDDEERYQWVMPTNGRDNYLVNFIAGCLVNWVATIAPELLRDNKYRLLIEANLLADHPSPELALDNWRKSSHSYLNALADKQRAGRIDDETHATLSGLANKIEHLFPKYAVIDRGEDLKESELDGELAAQRRRLANPQFMPSVTSFSVFHGGSQYFNRPGTVRTKIETYNSFRPTINTSEGEVLVPMGTCYYYELGTYLNETCFIGREVRSPDLTPKGGYASSVALVLANQRFLNEPYADIDSTINLHGISIARPNHGLAHTYRAMQYIDLVVAYFALHAADSQFQTFCQMITFEELELLRIAAAFSVTGRESEISAREDLTRYDEFRASCALHAEEFLSLHPIPWMNTTLKDRLTHIVRWMGNPRYEKPLDGEPAINQHEDLTEREIRSYYHRILTVAHKLDLPRCFDPHQFEDAMHLCRELSSPSLSQMSDYKNLLTYAISLIRAHGNALRTNISMEGELFACYLPYTSPFEMVSTNLRQCREMADTVPALKFMDSPQKESQKHASTPDSPRKLRK